MSHHAQSAVAAAGMSDGLRDGSVAPSKAESVSRTADQPGWQSKPSPTLPAAIGLDVFEQRRRIAAYLAEAQARATASNPRDVWAGGIDFPAVNDRPPERRREPEIDLPRSPDRLAQLGPRGVRPLGLFAGALLVLAAVGWLGGAGLAYWSTYKPSQPSGTLSLAVVVERIIQAESSGDPNLKNKRSTATGAGQFLDQTWLELIRAHRPDLAEGRAVNDILQLRLDPDLSREIMTRLIERNAVMLKKRGLQVTPGTLYLTHFAGSAGAVAILSAQEDADAATLMAGADATGRTTREKLVYANPFLAKFTVNDLKNWADRKMREPASSREHANNKVAASSK